METTDHYLNIYFLLKHSSHAPQHVSAYGLSSFGTREGDAVNISINTFLSLAPERELGTQVITGLSALIPVCNVPLMTA